MLSDVLSGSRTSRLTRDLVLERRRLRSVRFYASYPGDKYDGMCLLAAQPVQGKGRCCGAHGGLPAPLRECSAKRAARLSAGAAAAEGCAALVWGMRRFVQARQDARQQGAQTPWCVHAGQQPEEAERLVLEELRRFTNEGPTSAELARVQVRAVCVLRGAGGAAAERVVDGGGERSAAAPAQRATRISVLGSALSNSAMASLLASYHALTGEVLLLLRSPAGRGGSALAHQWCNAWMMSRRVLAGAAQGAGPGRVHDALQGGRRAARVAAVACPGVR